MLVLRLWRYLAIYDSFIVGGSTLLGNVKGVTSKVEVASDFLAANTQVNYVQLANLNLSPTLDKLLPQFPSGLTTLRLENTLLKAFPTEITSFTSLTTLYARYILVVVALKKSEGFCVLTMLLCSRRVLTGF